MIVGARIAGLRVLPSIVESEVHGDILFSLAVFANASSLPSITEGEENSGYILSQDCRINKFDPDIVEKNRVTKMREERVPVAS